MAQSATALIAISLALVVGTTTRPTGAKISSSLAGKAPSLDVESSALSSPGAGCGKETVSAPIHGCRRFVGAGRTLSESAKDRGLESAELLMISPASGKDEWTESIVYVCKYANAVNFQKR
ncbi:hypothetical protein BDV93DRAFT_527626 [Ceratobasidium sp. AG-I]|nr:hypothetical protein BDV93DRAFT_527626 [Ceratobasidium sp. AG-I]